MRFLFDNHHGNVRLSIKIPYLSQVGRSPNTYVSCICAGDALKANITTLGPLVLPLSEQILFFLVLVGRKVLRLDMKPYIPNFKLAFEHFCIHTGGRGVLDEMEKNLQLTEEQVEPSRMALYRWAVV